MALADEAALAFSASVLYSVQYLRFAAAALVVANHVLLSVNGPWRFQIGAAGVDIFFVISGFIMVFITETKETSTADFLKHRIRRVVPPYWIVTIAMAALAGMQLSAPHFVASMLFLPFEHPTMGETVPLYPPGWTLNYEFFFYALFATAMAINHTYRSAMVAGALAALVAAGLIFPSDNPVQAFYTNPIVIEFVYGMLLASLLGSKLPMPGLAICLGLAGLALAVAFPIPRLAETRCLIWGLPALLIVGGAVFVGSTSKPIKALVLLGDASYAIYVTHVITIGALTKLWRTAGFSAGIGEISLAFSVAIAAGLLFHFAVERPMLAIIRRKPEQATA